MKQIYRGTLYPAMTNGSRNADLDHCQYRRGKMCAGSVLQLTWLIAGKG